LHTPYWDARLNHNDMYNYEDYLDILQDYYKESEKYGGLVMEVVSTIIDSFLEDDFRTFEDVLDAAYEDAMDMPNGKQRMLLTALIDEMITYEG